MKVNGRNTERGQIHERPSHALDRPERVDYSRRRTAPTNQRDDVDARFSASQNQEGLAAEFGWQH